MSGVYDFSAKSLSGEEVPLRRAALEPGMLLALAWAAAILIH